ncbi:MAG: flagellar basal body rod protein FlgC [Clostridia bacterium]|nr:flagellar basal body rod protein FlgC [Clostridia bacterium]MDD4798283.1 flagellar basal body rod protein FlgC [Clostridia bacterium]
MTFLNTLNISGSALTAQKLRMDVVSSNIANATTTRTEDGDAYRRKLVVFRESNPSCAFAGVMAAAGQSNCNGVEAAEIVEDQSPFKAVYDPAHPDADENGYVMMPNVDTTEEMIDMMSASRSYEANVTVFNAVKFMASKALEIGR